MNTLKGFTLVPTATTASATRHGAAEAWERLALAAKTLRGIQMLAFGASVQPAGPGRDCADMVLNRVLAYIGEDATIAVRYATTAPPEVPEPAIPVEDAGVLRDFLSDYAGRHVPQGNAELFEAAFEAVTNNDLFDDTEDTRRLRGEVLEALCRWATVAMDGFRAGPVVARGKEAPGTN